MDGEVLGRGDVGEHEQRQVLHDVEAEVEAAKLAVAGTREGTAEVVVPVGEGHQEAGRRVQTDAEAPHVALGHLPAYGRAHGGQVIGHPAVCGRSLLEVEEQGPEDAEEEGDKWTADHDHGHQGEAKPD